MAEQYHRTTEQKQKDFQKAKEFEEKVEEALPNARINATESSDELDFFVPWIWVEAKEKRQRLTARWWLIEGTDEKDLFVVDELTVRRACKHFPWAYFILRDVPEDRMFLVSIAELVTADRVRRNRVGKGKWILDTSQFRQLDSLDGLMGQVVEDLEKRVWRLSECLTQGETLAQI